jgi:hypothetical protein
MNTVEDIPDEERARLKTVYTDPDPGRWYWDESTWRWELELYSDEYADNEGYVYIAPLAQTENRSTTTQCQAPGMANGS